jgi:hypothetical protein
VLRRGAATRDAEVEAAPLKQPVDLVGEQDEGRHRGGVVGLLLARVLQRQPEREERGLPASVARPVELLDPLQRCRAEQREPQSAIGGERLLWREVVNVGLVDLDGETACARGGVDQDQALA